jgi:small-conductance mechanosensitive channel
MWLHLLAVAGQIALLYVAQLGFNWLTRKLEIDRLTLVANKSRRKAVLRALITRLNVWLWICGIYTTIAWHIVPFFPDLLLEPWFSGRRLRDFLIGVTALAVISVVGRTIYVTSGRLRDLASGESSHWESVVTVLLADLLQVGLPIVTFIFVLPLFSLPPGIVQNSREIIDILVVLGAGYLVARQINLAADRIILSHRAHGGVDLRSRTLYTEVSSLRKVILAFVCFSTIAAAMIFSTPLRQLGTSLLASAGLLSVVAGVAAQRSLGQLFGGFQLAITQPILLDDTVVIEGEMGRIEEITLAYVVVHLWDQRRLVVPINRFLEKPFENWTRRSSEILGTVYLYVDYHLPLEELRAEFNRVLDAHPLWDRRSRNLQVTKANVGTMELRALVSAADPSKLWDLKCAVLEALITFIRVNHPACLPRTRVTVEQAGDRFPTDFTESERSDSSPELLLNRE